MHQEPPGSAPEAKSRWGLSAQGVSLAISILALVISAGSFYVSMLAERQNEAQYKDERSIVLSGIFNKTTQELSVKPVDVNFNFLMGKITLPLGVTKYSPQPIDEKGRIWGMVTLLYDVNQYAAKRFSVGKNQLGLAQLLIPCIISSYYTVKGDSHTDMSLYRIVYQFTITGKQTDPLNPEITGLFFDKHLQQNLEDASKYLDDVWFAISSQGNPETK
jgi:hypothetical protein